VIRRSTFGWQRSIQLWSCVATTTVTPTRWKSVNSSGCRLRRIAVEIGRRLIGQQHRRPVDHGAGDGQTLLLAAGEAIGLAFSRASRPTLSSAAWARRMASLARQAGDLQRQQTLSRALRSNSSFWSWKIMPKCRRT
jgi:hypothetical protein